MIHHAVPAEDGYLPPCGAYLHPGTDRLVWRGPYHDAATLDLAARTHCATMARWYLTRLALLADPADTLDHDT